MIAYALYGKQTQPAANAADQSDQLPDVACIADIPRFNYNTLTMSRPRQSDGRVHGVVVACRDADGRWLCIRRSATVAAPLKVCFPGGAIEANESQTSAVIREMQEELGIAVKPVKCVWRWDSPTTELTLWGWTADWPGTEIKADPAEVAEVLWLSADEISNHPDAMPTNRSFMNALMRGMEAIDRSAC